MKETSNQSNSVLGNLIYSEQDVIYFPEGMPGFEDRKGFLLLEDDEMPLVMSLQAAGAEHPSFVVVDPYAFVQDFQPVLSTADQNFFSGKTHQELKFLLITVLQTDFTQTVVNLKSPVVIDPETKRAKQVILENPDYPIRFFLFQDQ